jgi:hypothetical protein
MSTKKSMGQFYTVRSTYILEGVPRPPAGARIVEPFAGQGDILEWIGSDVEAYDIEPKHPRVVQRDTLLNPPDYKGKWVITNPPYLARNKEASKTVFDRYGMNDMYKCFIMSMIGCAGGTLIIPVGFFLSPRDMDFRCRDAFLSNYRLTQVKYFEEDVFPDTSATVVVVSFVSSDAAITEQTVEWIRRPTGERKTFILRKSDNWIIGGDVYTLPVPDGINVRRHVEGQALREGEMLTGLTLTALDSGKEGGRIKLVYHPTYVYPAKDTSRAYLTVCIRGRVLTPEEQQALATKFNEFIECKRLSTWSLFLPAFRESKEYARKRIPFDLAYRIMLHLLHSS